MIALLFIHGATYIGCHTITSQAIIQYMKNLNHFCEPTLECPSTLNVRCEEFPTDLIVINLLISEHCA